MNGSVSDSPPGIKKMEVEYNGGGGTEDRISSLPNFLILHIFSFMPTKYVVATTVLSKRWDNLWTSTSKLDICDKLLRSTTTTTSWVTESFMNFVDRVLCLHSAPTFTKFRISCQYFYGDTRVNPWISIALRCNVQELILDFPLKQPFRFPRRIFYCESLTSLEIDLFEAFYLQISDFTCFPNLKHLHLASVWFCVDHSTRQVFFSFPVLEEFYARNSRWLKISTVEISAPTLKRLTLHESDECARNEAEIIVDAESLVFLKLSTNRTGKYSIRSKPSVLDAVIDFSTSNSLFNLLGGLCTVKYLQLHARTIKALSANDAILQLPTFFSLVNLTVTLKDENCDIKDLLYLLHKMPNVEYLVFDALRYRESSMALGLIPQCALSNLKSVQIDCFVASESELFLVNFFLKNAQGLERMRLTSSMMYSLDSKKQVDITKKLLMMPRASPACMIDFI